MRLLKNSHRKVLVGIPIYLTIAVAPASLAGGMDVQPEESVFETGTEADVQKEIDRRSITLRPTDEDAKEIEMNVHLDSFTWEAYRRATLQVAKSDKNMVLFDVLAKLANAEIKPPVIAGCFSGIRNSSRDCHQVFLSGNTLSGLWRSITTRCWILLLGESLILRSETPVLPTPMTKIIISFTSIERNWKNSGGMLHAFMGLRTEKKGVSAEFLSGDF